MDFTLAAFARPIVQREILSHVYIHYARQSVPVVT